MKTVVFNQKHGEDFFLTNHLLNPNNIIYTNNQLKNLNTESSVPANVYTFDDEYELELLAPGLEKKDIDINVDHNNVMTVSAETDDEEKEKGNCQRQEFVNKGFKRSFQLPEDAISDDITAIYRNGIISLFIPKKEDFKIQNTVEILTN